MAQNHRNKRSKTVRQAVLDGLNSVFQKGAYSGIVLDHMVKEEISERRDVGFATRLFYGVLERSVSLDAAIRTYTKKPLSKLDPPVLNILRMGIYQLCYMDSVPESAAVNESVKLVEYAKKMSAKGFVNAVLRRFIREGKSIPVPDAKKDALAAMAVETSCPKWILSLWSKQYGEAFAKETALAMLTPPQIQLRVNPLVLSPEALAKELQTEGVAVQPAEGLPNALTVVETEKSVDAFDSYRRGAFYVQDISSQWCVQALAAKPGERILDVCAAPGGKSIGAAMDMENSGEILAFDLYEHKVSLMQQNFERLGLTCIHPGLGNASEYRESLGFFDGVLCDVPCSGLGVMRRKPEIRFKSEAEVGSLPQIQYEILCTAARYVKPGGRLIYSTCTINRAENSQVCERFLSEHPEFCVEKAVYPKGAYQEKFGITILPQSCGGDGFYFVKLVRK